MSARRLPLGLRLAALLACAGCGGSGSSSTSAPAGPDPASLAPADAAFYAEGLVRPTGDMREGALAAIGKVLNVEDASAEIHRLVRSADDADENFDRDVEPWLGQRIGLFVDRTGRSDDSPPVAVIAAVRDREVLKRTLARMRREGSNRSGGTYRGVAFDVDADEGDVNAAVGDFFVFGDRPAFEAAVDAWKGASLADSERFADATDGLRDDELGFGYFDPRTLSELARLDRDAIDPQTAEQLRRVVGSEPITLGLTADADEIALELHGDAAGTALAGGEDGGLSVGELPGDAWLALATPALGPILREVLDATGSHAAAAQQVGTLGLDLDRDLLEPLGGLAAFARGTTPLDLGGGIMLKLDSAAAAGKLVTRLQAIANGVTGGGARTSGDGFEVSVPRSPQPIVVRTKDDRLAAGYAASSADDLLEPQQRFDESDAGTAALATLGEGFTPSLVVIAPPLVELLASLEQIGLADLSPALPYLRAYRSLAVGTKRDDDHVTVRVVAALR
jgi:hypothetical protein